MAATNDISRSARRLVAEHIDSVGVLDLLLALHGDPARAWSAEELCEHLRCPGAWARGELERLRDAGLVAASEGRFRYLPGSPYDPAVDELAVAWRRDRRRTTRLIFVASRQYAG